MARKKSTFLAIEFPNKKSANAHAEFFSHELEKSGVKYGDIVLVPEHVLVKRESFKTCKDCREKVKKLRKIRSVS